MSGRNHQFHSMLPGQTGNRHEVSAIKQEKFDEENSASDWTSESRMDKFVGEEDYDVKNPEITMMNELQRPPEASRGIGQLSRRTRSEIMFREQPSLANDFGFIRRCLKSVLGADSKKRHELVRAMSSKLKYIEAMTTGKSLTKDVVVKLEKLDSSSSNIETNLVELESNLRSEQSNGIDEDERSSSGEQREGFRSESDQEQAMKSSEVVRLVGNVGDGSVICNVCDRIISSIRRFCPACSSFVSRTRSRCRESGVPLPSCQHKNFSGGAACSSCRVHKYIMLSSGVPRSPTQRRWKGQRPAKVPQVRRRRYGNKTTRSGKTRKCLVCEKTSRWFKGWRCSACFMFHMRMIERYEAGEEPPECSHDGYYAGVGCKGCRRIRLQREAAIREPQLASRLPEAPPIATDRPHENDE